jgi:hypothetical protein
MSFLNDLFTFKGLLAIAEKTRSKQEPGFEGYGRQFKIVHPSDEFPAGRIAFLDTADTETVVKVGLLWKEATPLT